MPLVGIKAQCRNTIKIHKALAVSMILHSDAGRHPNIRTKFGPAQAAQDEFALQFSHLIEMPSTNHKSSLADRVALR